MRNTLVLFGLLFGLALAPMQAANIPCSGQLWDQNTQTILIDECVVGDKLFSDFTYSGQIISGSGLADGNIFISPLDADPLNPGIQLQSVWRADPNSVIDLALGFNVSTLSGEALIKDASLFIGGFSGSGVLGGGEDLCLGGPFPCAGGVLLAGALPATIGLTTVDWTDTVGPVNTVGVLKDISLDNTGNDAPTEFSIIQQNFSQVPEPGTVALFGLGLTLAGLAVRRRRS